jgi:3-deoxy-manno-octulosonate cytidylyltransferase (CMP-KDO synthetase)
MKDIATHQSNKSIFIVIPARFASTRLPGKPLLKISTECIISHVAKRAKILADRLSKQSKVKSVSLIVATDHEQIFNEVKKIGVLATMTSTELRNGTERVFAAMNVMKQNVRVHENDLVINIQGDEPFFSIDDVENLAIAMLQKESIPLGTLAFKRSDSDLFFTSSVVKVVRDENQIALYFSRSPIPYPKELLGASGKEWLHKLTNLKENISFLHHVGVYVFRYHALCKYAESMKSSALETFECLEQLRALEAGWKILVTDALSEPFGIDTPEDFEKAELYSQKIIEKKL